MRILIPGVVALLAACASASAPPGGPVITTPPELVTVVPDSGALRTAPRAVVFRFDRVISERSGGADMSSLVLISPTDGQPRVNWNRNAIAVRPRRDWRPNTAYTVTLLPGFMDLRGNILREPITTVFSTGGEIPGSRIEGTLFDWVAGRPAARGIVEALSLPDSVLHLARADSAGRFSLPHLRAGSYRVRGFVDLNNNRALDMREPWDTAMVALQDSAEVELLAFVHDTIPPTIGQIAAIDSVTLRVSFERPIDPELELSREMFLVTGPEDVVLTVLAAARQVDWERARHPDEEPTPEPQPEIPPTPPRPGALPPPARPPAPPPRAAAPTPSRPPPALHIILTLEQPVAGGTAYTVRATGVRGLLGASRTVERSFTPPRAQAVPGTPATDPPPVEPPAGR